MSKRIEGLQDASLEIGKPDLPPDLQEYVDRHPWKNVKQMREFVARQLIEPVMIKEDDRTSGSGANS